MTFCIVVKLCGRATIETIADLDKRLRSHEEQGLRIVVSSSSVRSTQFLGRN